MKKKDGFLRLTEAVEKGYRLSEYNIYLNDKNIVYNTITQSIVKFDKNELGMENIEELIECGIVVEKGTDEYEYLREEYEHRDKLIEKVNLIVALTLDCQFRCLYCYEEHPKVYMKGEVKKHLVNFVEKQAKLGRDISIVWYGGEPMLDFDSIEELTNKFVHICKKSHVTYEASMISNGYEYSDDSISKLDKLMIRTIQITLDGMEEMHEKRRPLISGGKSFTHIIENMEKIKKNSHTKIHLRINVDKENIRSAYKLAEYLASLDFTDIDMNLGMMKKFGCDHSCSSCIGELFTMKEFAEEFLRFRDFIEKLGFLNAIKKMTPEYKVNSCTMDAPGAYVIDPYGDIYKCITKVGQKKYSIGNISDEMEEPLKNTITPFEFESCSKCKYFPICKGGCLMNNGGKERECNIWKFVTEDLIEREVN